MLLFLLRFQDLRTINWYLRSGWEWLIRSKRYFPRRSNTVSEHRAYATDAGEKPRILDKSGPRPRQCRASDQNVCYDHVRLTIEQRRMTGRIAVNPRSFKPYFLATNLRRRCAQEQFIDLALCECGERVTRSYDSKPACTVLVQ